MALPFKPGDRSCVLVGGIKPNDPIERCCHQPAGSVKLRAMPFPSILCIARQQTISVDRVKDANAVNPQGSCKALAVSRVG